MSSIPFVKDHIALVKNHLRDEFPHIQSAHLSEALAAALGFKTHAALLSLLQTSNLDPHYVLIDDEAFDEKLTALGHTPEIDFSFEFLEVPFMLNTTCDRAWDISYANMRDKAWRNVVVCAVNEGLRQRIFSLKPDDNRWEGWTSERNSGRVASTFFDFELPTGATAKAYAADAGFGELAIHVAVCPTDRAHDFVRAYNGGFAAGDAFAATWLERERGAWIQSSTGSFKCRKGLLRSLAEMYVRPAGFGDRGRVIM
jgi:hypothetical protein